jgi:two-component system chemotaxis response regulator CheB
VSLLSEKKEVAAVRKEDEATIAEGPVEVVAIASSTGGPPAIQAILSSLPSDFGANIVIAQHMPPGFTRSFAERLNKLSPLMVSEAAPGDRLKPGTVFIAPGGSHLIVNRDREGLVVELVNRAPADKYVPSADKMMISVAETCGPAALGVVLTGMGRDGVEGAIAIKQRRGQCLAESEKSAVIFGMPQEAIRAGVVDKVLPLDKMAAEIVERCKAGKGSGSEKGP